MTGHVDRILAPVARALAEVDSGRGSVLDLQSAAVSAASALDNSEEGLVKLLQRLDNDLEVILFAVAAEDQQSAIGAATADLRSALGRSSE